ncbi:MAG: DUF192 domain-containing protein, partial [Bdellovibrionota bacterium]
LLLTAPLPAQPKRLSSADKVDYAKKKISIGKHVLTVEIADTALRREHGLMFRKELAPNSGMLFIFDSEQPLAFWMKNTLIPLSIAYIDKNKRIVDIQEMVPAVTGDMFPKSYPSKKPAMYALEMSKGWFAKNSVGIGSKFSFTD